LLEDPVALRGTANGETKKTMGGEGGAKVRQEQIPPRGVGDFRERVPGGSGRAGGRPCGRTGLSEC